MVECWHPKECALLINILGAKCPRCYRTDPRVLAEIELARAKADAKPAKMKASRRTWARGLQDAKRARTDRTSTGRGRSVS